MNNGRWQIFAFASWGFLLIACTVIGLVVGLFLDSKLKTSPVFTLIMLVIGTAAGFWQVIKDINRCKYDK